MATPFSADEAHAAIRAQGFFSIQDQELGKRFLDMENKKSSFVLKTVEGFNFCKANVLTDTRIQDTLRAFERPHVLADYTRLAPSRGTIYQLRRGGSDDVLLVHLWEAGSSPTYYERSQNAELWRIVATNNTWQVLGAELRAAGCTGNRINFEHGGLVILDARLAVDFGDTSPIMAAFATPAVLKKRPMDWPFLTMPKAVKPSQLEGINIHVAQKDQDKADEVKAEGVSDERV